MASHKAPVGTETVLEVRSSICKAMKEAAKLSSIHPEMLQELDAIEQGENPRDIIGVRWCDLMAHRFDKLPQPQQVEFFDNLANGK